MVVSDVVDAIPGEVVENAAAVGSKELTADAALVVDIHLQQIEQVNPLRIYVG